MSTLRTDPHRPSALDPADYVWVGEADRAEYWGEKNYSFIDHGILSAHGVEKTGVNGVPWYFGTKGSHAGEPLYRCHHCGKHGSNIRYFVFYLHIPTKKVIVVGQICSKKLDLADRDQLDLQKRAAAWRLQEEQSKWVREHMTETAFLEEYKTQREAGGIFHEFFDSLHGHIVRYHRLTDKQLVALQNAMKRTFPWQAEPIDGDRHQGVVTEIDADPTEAQLIFIAKLAEQVGTTLDAIEPLTRQDASELINSLKATIAAEKPSKAVRTPEDASEKQLAYIRVLLDGREMSYDSYEKAVDKLVAGLTKDQASAWIKRLLELPERVNA